MTEYKKSADGSYWIESRSNVGNEFYKTHSCEICKSPTVPTLTIIEGEKWDASIGAFIVRKHMITGDETRRSVLCYQCMRKTDEKSICTKYEKPFMEFVGAEDLYD
jgi:hypothetical protein